jgi:hypothetical protein
VAATLDPVRALAATWLRGRARQFGSLASVKAWAGLTGMAAAHSARRRSPQTRAELGELRTDLDAAGLLPAAGSSRRISGNAHRPAPA